MKKEEAITFFGNKKKLATALGISQAAISQWGESVPPLRAYQLELLTRGKLKAADLSLTGKEIECSYVQELQD
ncbi:Cro/Cl family transcriptional regulator [Vibrio parahaemolyticus]|nr:Cro/Cl family transcriptional regulator [Vibrio parahaemolyticus]